ncbi:MAG TPA: ABC transporter permease [Gemmatimonadaceae bacterium]|nr:ABC transporter permease [Gemmatimonadaceae bacterium]
MPILEAVRLALNTLRVQKLKSFFTLIGVVIGVMFLIAVISIVSGMQRYVEEDFAGTFFGVNTFTLRRFPQMDVGETTEDSWREMMRRPRLFEADITIAREALPPGTLTSIETIIFSNANSAYARPRQVFAIGADADYFRIKKYDLDRGRIFTQQEVDRGLPVVVIGTEVAAHFFPDLDPIGRELKMNGIPYTVIGLLKKQGSVFGFSLDRMFIAPWTSPIRRVTNPRFDIDAMIVQASDASTLTEAMESVRGVLRAHRHVPPGKRDNFALETADAALEFFNGLTSRLMQFGAILPAIGLVVSAMVIMNIMLVAVAERTAEIGIRKALGARRSDIMSQFLVEAATLSVVGAAIGIAFGIGLAQLVAKFSPLPASVAPWSILFGLTVGAAVGIAAGIYPASRAARLDPIAALRHET